MFRSPLSRARGLGSAKEGSGHWIAQRITAIALIPLVIWFVYSIVGLAGAERELIVAWISTPFNTLMTCFFLTAMFYHGSLGIQVVIEDYVSCHCAKTAGLIITKLACFAAAVTGILATLSLFFKG